VAGFARVLSETRSGSYLGHRVACEDGREVARERFRLRVHIANREVRDLSLCALVSLPAVLLVLSPVRADAWCMQGQIHVTGAMRHTQTPVVTTTAARLNRRMGGGRGVLRSCFPTARGRERVRGEDNGRCPTPLVLASCWDTPSPFRARRSLARKGDSGSPAPRLPTQRSPGTRAVSLAQAAALVPY
jgi:hypothetical protein